MYLLTRNNLIVDYCTDGYISMGSNAICQSKNCTFNDVTIINIEDTTLPADIDTSTYEYILGEFIKVHNDVLLDTDPVSDMQPATKRYVDNRILSVEISLTVAGWSSNSQTVNAEGVTTSNTVIVSPAPADHSKYIDAGIICTAQGNGTLTFTCIDLPTSNVTVNIVILEVQA